MVMEEREKILAEKVRELLTEKFGKNYEFRVVYNDKVSSSGEDSWLWKCYSYPTYYDLQYPFKIKGGRELGTMFMRAELRHVYFDGRRKIIWPDDFIDPYPIFLEIYEVLYPIAIDEVVFYRDGYAEIRVWMDIDLAFLSEAYYAVWFIYPGINERLMSRENRMKFARIIPGVVKDIEVFLRIIKESLERCNIKVDFSNVKFREGDDVFPLVVNLEDCSKLFFNIERPKVLLRFPIKGMKDEEIVDNIMKRVYALAEIKRKFRKEWLPSEERRKCYESTMRYPEDPYRERFWGDEKPHIGFREIVNWPTGNKEEDEKLRSAIENLVREEALSYEKGEQAEISRIYNLDGYRLEWVNYKFENGKIVGGELRINKRKTYKFPLEKIEFLKEEFPELWKKSRKRK